MNAVLDVDARGQRKHGRLAAAVAQPVQDVKARHARQADVQDDQIEGLVLQDAIGAQAVILAVDRVAKTAQPAHECVGKILVVFDYQNAHGAIVA